MVLKGLFKGKWLTQITGQFPPRRTIPAQDGQFPPHTDKSHPVRTSPTQYGQVPPNTDKSHPRRTSPAQYGQFPPKTDNSHVIPIIPTQNWHSQNTLLVQESHSGSMVHNDLVFVYFLAYQNLKTTIKKVCMSFSFSRFWNLSSCSIVFYFHIWLFWTILHGCF